MEGFGAAWFNPAGELYRIEKFWDTATPLGTAKDRENGKDQVCVWTNDYRGTRVFGTTLGHHNETVDANAYSGNSVGCGKARGIVYQACSTTLGSRQSR